MTDLDDDCVSELAAYRSITEAEMIEELQQVRARVLQQWRDVCL